MREFCFYGDRPVVTPGKHNYPPERAQIRQTCCICGATPCHRIVGKEGYCGQHVREAFQAAKLAKQPKGWEEEL